MPDHVNLEASNSNSPELGWKSVTKGKRSKKPVGRNVNEITKVANVSPKKFDGFVTTKQVSNGPDHIPPKKRRGPLPEVIPYGTPGPQSFAQFHEDPLSPQSHISSPHGDFKIQSKGLCNASVTNSKVDSAGFPDVLNQKLYNPEDFSGIALLVAAACLEGIDDTNQFKVIEQHPITEKASVSASREPIKCSVSIENKSSPIDAVKESTDVRCSSLANVDSRSESMQVNEDVVVNELEAEKVDRLYWDLNINMDAWEKPLENSARGAPSVDVSDPNLEVEKVKGDGCKYDKDRMEHIELAILGSFQQENDIDNVTTASADEMSYLPDSSANISTPAGQTNNVSAPNITAIEAVALPFPSKNDDGSPSCNLSSCSAKVGSSLGNCRLDVSQGDSSNTVGSKDMTGLQDGNESPYEDGELRLSIPCSWEDNKFDYGDNECVDYESDGVDYRGSEVVEVGSADGSLGVEKKNLSLRETSISELNSNGSLKNRLKEEVDVGGIMAKSCAKMRYYMCENNLGRRHSSYHLGGIETKGSHLKEMYSRTNRLNSQSVDEGSGYMDVMEKTNTGYLQQNNRSRIYSRPIRDVNSDKIMGRHRSPFHVHERNGEGDQWGSRSHVNHGPGGPKYYRPRNMTSDFEKVSEFNSEVNRQSMYYSSKASHQADRRSSYEVDDYLCVQRRTPANTDRSRANSGSYIQGVSQGNRNECYDTSHEKRTLPSSRMPRYLSKRELSHSPPSGRFSQGVIARRRSRSRSRSRSPHCGRRYPRPNFRSEARVDGERIPFLKPSFPTDHAGSARGRYPPLRNSRWVDDHDFVKNLRNRTSSESASERIFRYNSISSDARYKEDNYHRPGNRPRRFQPVAGAARGCNFGKKYDDRRDDRVYVPHQARVSDANSVLRYKHDPEDNFDGNVTRKDDVRNTEHRYVARSSHEDRRSFKV